MPVVQTSEKSINFSYSSPEDPLFRRGVIKFVEAIGGQRRLKKLYEQFGQDYAESKDFFAAAMELLALDVSFDDACLKDIPSDGPVVFVANHPYGVIDGIALTWLARKARPDVKVMANHVLCQAPDAAGSLLPVDFSGTKAALKTNLETRRSALEALSKNGAIGIFPAGGVAVSEKPHKGPAVDSAWHPFAAKMIRKSGATVVPVYFCGQNSRLFQIASHTSYTLRLALFFFETARRIGSEFELAVGKPITPEEIESFQSGVELNHHLRKKTFELALKLKRPKTGYPPHDREFRSPRIYGG